MKDGIATLTRSLEEYYQKHGRHDLPWRQTDARGRLDPYYVLVSEIMLQQTQVERVIPKYAEFLELFPTIFDLAHADLADVLRAWQGLGYNRRAKFLWQTARIVGLEHAGVLPQTNAQLVTLPGIGLNTAGAILAYAFNQPALFVETNIRTVFIGHLFKDQDSVTDQQILQALAKALHETSLPPRLFYWALMDYGSHLKRVHGNLNKLSKTYTKQSVFKGSRRQVRGAVLRQLTAAPASKARLAAVIQDERLPAVLEILLQEGLVRYTDQQYHL